MSTSITISKQIAIKDEGVVKTSDVNSINFTGTGITATNVGNDVTVNVPGAAGVTAVTATTPVVATGTTTPVISLATNYGDTQNPYSSKTANHILAAPNGTAGAPTFRAIVASDVPTLNQNTTGTAANVTGIVAVANGGTGTATPSLVAGTNITITGSFPNQTIAVSGGEIVKFGTGTLIAGQLYYLNASGVWTFANASAESSSTGMLGIAVGASPTVDGLLVRGYAVNIAYTQTTGSVIYIGTAAGSITATAPSVTTQVVRVVGYKTSLTNTIYLSPDPTWVTLA